MIDTKKLLPNWRQIHESYISQLEGMISSSHPQSLEAAMLIQRTRAEIVAIENALKEGK